MKKYLLDCTLRDGGYTNDWEFGHKNLISVYERLVDSGVDIIEVGFLDERRPFDINRSIMPDTASVSKIWSTIDKKAPMTVGMIDYGTCSIDKIERCEDSFLDGIRVIFKKHLMKEAMEFCRQVKEKGYKVFSQLVSITSYNDEELMQLIELVNEVKPYAVSMVDTYGLLRPSSLLHYYQLLDENVVPEVQIGFHAHNNFQLAYANALAFLEKESKHDILVDGTLFGMGKSAGNAPLELLAMTLNDEYGASYNLNPMFESIEESIMECYAKSPWGYKLFFYLCALNECHPNYLTQLKKKEDLSTSEMNKLLGKIPAGDVKLLYDGSVMEKLYEESVKERELNVPGEEAFKAEIDGRKVLLLGPGKNIELQKLEVLKYCTQKRPYVIAVNYVPKEIYTDCIFVTNSKRYLEISDEIAKATNPDIKLLATSNIECRGGEFDFHVNKIPLLDSGEKFADNSFLMLLKLLINLGAQEIACAGFDGYSDKESNYFDPVKEYGFVKNEAMYLNEHMKKKIEEMRKNACIRFITFSAYDQEDDIYSGRF